MIVRTNAVFRLSGVSLSSKSSNRRIVDKISLYSLYNFIVVDSLQTFLTFGFVLQVLDFTRYLCILHNFTSVSYQDLLDSAKERKKERCYSLSTRVNTKNDNHLKIKTLIKLCYLS